MGEVISLARAAEARVRRRRERAELAAMHPSLRWTAAGDPFAHRRAHDGGTACGLSGPLLLADTAGRLCPTCYRLVAARA